MTLLLTFAEIAVKQSLSEHIFWALWYAALIVFCAYSIKQSHERKMIGLLIVMTIITILNILAFISHLASLKYVV